MSGYQETLTDPSYHGQIVVATAPQIGNTGWNHEDAESRGDKIWVAGYAVRDPSPRASNWRATGTLSDELVRQEIVGVAGIDTRAVVRHLRSRGSMKAGVFSGDAANASLDELLTLVRSQPSMVGADLAGEVSTEASYVVEPDGPQRFTVAAIDLGIKTNTPRNFARRGIRSHVLPSTVAFDQIAELKPDGVFLSNGPGDPATADHIVGVTREVLGAGIPLFGICFGNQILGRALGRSTYKMVFGHRGINVPVIDHATGRVAVTAQNHGFALEGEAGERFDTPFGSAEVSHTCANDGVVEGIKLVDGRAFSVQYHPEAAAGPHDAEYLFDQFVDLMAGVGPQPAGGDRQMPYRTDLRHVLLIGSGPIFIGQACEFDYSGTQSCRVLRAEGLQVSLVNSNPATIMTDPEFADHTYVEPITPAFVERVIAQQAERGNKIDALLATLGGQTALNTAVALYENGALQRYGVELIGADFEAIQRGEDRQRFKDIVAKVGGESASSRVCFTMDEVRETVEELGLPVVVRPSFTMGGLGSGMAYSAEDVERMAGDGLTASPSANVLIEESIYGWKEFELELMRDGHDNVVVVCSIENVDPMGVHTGDSVTVAPAMTLTDREYQRMRDLGIAILREVGVDTGGCNIQFAVNPDDGRLIVIEMNPRVSRSSALASKATGFPIAKIAAKLAIGYTLDEIVNDITKETPACFEPTLDYVVVKAPRFAFEKFPGADTTLTTTMKSVGEAMSLGRNFIEALGKVMRSLETSRAGFWTAPDPEGDANDALDRLKTPGEGRLYDIELALRLGASVEQVAEASGIDPWFVAQIAELLVLRQE